VFFGLGPGQSRGHERLYVLLALLDQLKREWDPHVHLGDVIKRNTYRTGLRLLGVRGAPVSRRRHRLQRRHQRNKRDCVQFVSCLLVMSIFAKERRESLR